MAVDSGQAELNAVVDGIADPQERLRACVRVVVRAHCERPTQSFVALSELRCLKGDVSEEIRFKRVRIQRMFDDAVDSGVKSGQFRCAQSKVTSVAILTMCTAVATWYRSGGDLRPDEVANIYEDIVLKMVNAQP